MRVVVNILSIAIFRAREEEGKCGDEAVYGARTGSHSLEPSNSHYNSDSQLTGPLTLT